MGDRRQTAAPGDGVTRAPCPAFVPMVNCCDGRTWAGQVPLLWRRLDEKKVSRVQFSKEFQGYERDSWPEIIDWMIEHMIKLEKATKQYLSQANSQIKNNS